MITTELSMWGLSYLMQDVGGFITKLVVHGMDIILSIMGAVFNWIIPVIAGTLAEILGDATGTSTAAILANFMGAIGIMGQIMTLAGYLMSIFVQPAIMAAGITLLFTLNILCISVRFAISIWKMIW